MKRIFKKPTIIFIIGIILLVIGIPYGIYGLTLPGGDSLGGALILFIAIPCVLFFVAFDRILVQFLSQKILNLSEVIFLIIAATVYTYKNRAVEIIQLNQESKFLIVIENNGDLKTDNYTYKFPFDKVIRTDKNFVIATDLPENIGIETPEGLEYSYYYNVYHYKNYPKVVLFSYAGNIMQDSASVLRYINEMVK